MKRELKVGMKVVLLEKSSPFIVMGRWGWVRDMYGAEVEVLLDGPYTDSFRIEINGHRYTIDDEYVDWEATEKLNGEYEWREVLTGQVAEIKYWGDEILIYKKNGYEQSSSIEWFMETHKKVMKRTPESIEEMKKSAMFK